jgi:hypothetical protein
MTASDAFRCDSEARFRSAVRFLALAQLYVSLYDMTTGLRRARREGAVATVIEELVESFGVPLATPAVRALLADRGRPTSAEHLARVAAGEQTELLRTRMPPRLAMVIAPDGARVSPRWWAGGDWRLLRRISTEDALAPWRSRLVAQICSELIGRRRPAAAELVTLVRATMAQLDLDGELMRLPDIDDWQAVQALLLDNYPGVVVTHDVSTPEQYEAEAALLAADLPATARYFGR